MFRSKGHQRVKKAEFGVGSSGHVKENTTKVPELVEVNQMGEDDGAAGKFWRGNKKCLGRGGGSKTDAPTTSLSFDQE